MGITNKATIKDEATIALRNQCAKRATTICYLLDEAKKLGLDEAHARKAIWKYGEDIGDDIKKQMKDPNDLTEFARYFGVGLDRNIYEMETITSDAERLYIDFHYCPYVAQWLKMGRSPEEIDTLCDIAMEGDRGIGSRFSGFKFELGKTIAQGHHVCQIRFDTKK